MSIYRHILLATDLTEASQEAEQTAFKLAQCFAAKLSLLHILDPFPLYACGYPGMINFEECITEEAEKHALRVAKTLEIPEGQVLLERGMPKLQIVDIAHKIGADLIITGHHSRHGLMVILGTSTARGVIQGAKCDVLVVRHPEKNELS